LLDPIDMALGDMQFGEENDDELEIADSDD